MLDVHQAKLQQQGRMRHLVVLPVDASKVGGGDENFFEAINKYAVSTMFPIQKDRHVHMCHERKQECVMFHVF